MQGWEMLLAAGWGGGAKSGPERNRAGIASPLGPYLVYMYSKIQAETTWGEFYTPAFIDKRLVSQHKREYFITGTIKWHGNCFLLEMLFCTCLVIRVFHTFLLKRELFFGH